MLRSIASPAAASGLSMMTLDRVFGVEDVAAVRTRCTPAVAHPALVLVALEDEAVLDALVFHYLGGHLLQLVQVAGGSE